jgi:integrase
VEVSGIAMICSLFKRGRFWHAKVQLENWPGERRFSLHTTDKQIAQAKLQERHKELEREALGYLLPSSIREAAQRPLGELVEAFLGDMRAREKSANTLRIYSGALRKLSAACGWNCLPGVKASDFCEWRKDCGLRAKTVNDYMGVWSRFFRWLKRQRLAIENPFEFIEPVDGRASEREYRRALTADEASRLLATAPHPRRVVYHTALDTGLRRHEVAHLRWADIYFGGAQRSDGSADAAALSEREGSPPLPGAGEGPQGQQATVRIPASLAKNRRAAVREISPDLAGELRALRPADAAPFQLVFPHMVPEVETFKRDLAQAEIPFVDGLGRRADLHALRKTFGTAMLLNGEHPRVVMEAMRHSDMRLTMKLYTDAGQLPVGAALARLPWNKGAKSVEEKSA